VIAVTFFHAFLCTRATFFRIYGGDAMTWQDDAVRLHDEGRTFPEIARLMLETHGVVLDPEQIRSVYRRRLQKQRVQKDRVVFEDIKKPCEDDVEHFFECMVNLQEAQQALDTRQVDATVTLGDDKPVGIALWADWHVGSIGVNYQALRTDMDTILATDGLYVVGLGDYRDNFIAGAPVGGGFEAITTPGMQDEVVRWMMRRTAGKWLGLCDGCHDHWTAKQTGKDFIATLAEDAQALNLWHGGTLTLNLGEQTYRGHVRHKFPGESKYNPLNPARNMMDEYGQVDFAALAHRHRPAISHYPKAGRRITLLRPGGYKVRDDHGQQVGGYAGIPTVAMVLLRPDRHLLRGYVDLEEGIEALRHARAEV
jgi:hypothetical protein